MIQFIKREWPVIILMTTMVGFMGYRAMTCQTGSCGILVPLTQGAQQNASFSLQPWSTQDCEGKAFDSKALDDKVALVNFWKTDCGVCIGEFPLFKKMQAEFGDEGLLVVAPSLDGDGPTLSQLTKKYELNFPILLATDDMVSQFQVGGGVPLTYLVNREGQVVHTLRGAVSEEGLKNLIAELL